MRESPILSGHQPASLSGNTYQYESVNSGSLSPATFQKGGRYFRFNRRRTGRKFRKCKGRKSMRRGRGSRSSKSKSGLFGWFK